MIYEYQPIDEVEIINCLIELQSAESKIESIRISSKEVAENYFKEVQNKISNNSGRIFVSKKGNQVTGLLIVSVEKNEPYEREGKHLLIMDIVVKSNFRQQGIGKELMKKAEAFALDNNLNEIRLYTLINNREALNLYYNRGFQDFGIALTKKIKNNFDLSKLEIKKSKENEQIPYDLLLLSDDTKEAIDKNLNNGELFLAEINNKVIAAFILKITEKETIEIKNIAVLEDQQGSGIGTILLNYIISISAQRGFKNLIVGTCDFCNKEIEFYKKSGFNITNIRKNFFIDNYKDPIYENGMQIKDMIVLSIGLNAKMV